MKKLLLILMIGSLSLGCKKAPKVTPVVITAPYVAKMGDIVRWISPTNPNPNDQMRIVTLYYDANKNPLTATVIDGSVYFTMPVGEFILWK